MLYKRIDLPSDEPVQFVGVYVTKWGRTDEPAVAFREATGCGLGTAIVSLFIGFVLER